MLFANVQDLKRMQLIFKLRANRNKVGATPTILKVMFVCSIMVAPVSGTAQDEIQYRLTDGSSVASLEQFRECDACPEMIVMPLGSFMMGAIKGESRNPFDFYGEGATGTKNDRGFLMTKLARIVSGVRSVLWYGKAEKLRNSGQHQASLSMLENFDGSPDYMLKAVLLPAVNYHKMKDFEKAVQCYDEFQASGDLRFLNQADQD